MKPAATSTSVNLPCAQAHDRSAHGGDRLIRSPPTRAAMTGVEMDMFQVKVNVANPRVPERSFEEPFWVDTARCTASPPRIACGPSASRPRSPAISSSPTARKTAAWWARPPSPSRAATRRLPAWWSSARPPRSFFWRRPTGISASRSIQPRRSSARSRPSSGRLGRVDAACRGSTRGNRVAATVFAKRMLHGQPKPDERRRGRCDQAVYQEVGAPAI